jgi:hypothetical protein
VSALWGDRLLDRRSGEAVDGDLALADDDIEHVPPYTLIHLALHRTVYGTRKSLKHKG